ncbi:MAG: hypothetical protein QXO48_06470 [Desulfurococcaceae archaeon]
MELSGIPDTVIITALLTETLIVVLILGIGRLVVSEICEMLAGVEGICQIADSLLKMVGALFAVVVIYIARKLRERRQWLGL